MIHEVNARIYAAKSKIYNPYHVNMRPYKEDMRPNPSDIRPPPKYILLNLKEIRQIKKSSPIKQKNTKYITFYKYSTFPTSYVPLP